MKKKNVTEKDEHMLTAGLRLKKLREDANLTQDELAELIDNLPENNRTGRSRNQISYIENGQRAISADYARLLSKVLHVTPEYLLLETPYKNSFEEKYRSDNTGKFIENFFNELGYQIEHPSYERYTRLITTGDLLKNEKYINGIIDLCNYGEPIYERKLIDNKGRKILIYSDELHDIFEDIIEYAKWKIEQKFKDPRRYETYEDAQGTFSNNKAPDTD